jgi:hypothetical protein
MTRFHCRTGILSEAHQYRFATSFACRAEILSQAHQKHQSTLAGKKFSDKNWDLS